MFKENKYTRWYFKLIDNAKTRGIIDGYIERHHIIPKCLGGSNKKDNIVKLTAREHFVAHLLLTKMTDHNGIRFALVSFMAINNSGQKHNRYLVRTSRLYEYVKLCNKEASIVRNKNRTYKLGYKIIHNPITREQKRVDTLDNIPEGWVIGSGKGRYSANKGKIYCYNPNTKEVKSFDSEMDFPIGWIKGNPNANTADFSNIRGTKYFHNKELGIERRLSKCPDGWEPGRISRWTNNGSINIQMKYGEKLPDGFHYGRISVTQGRKLRRNRKDSLVGKSVKTPLGYFDHILDFTDTYKVGRGFFDHLDSKLPVNRKSLSYLVDELTKVGYDFTKTKRENGFDYI